MNLTIDLNTIVLLCGLIINGAIMIGANRQNNKYIVEQLKCHGDDIGDLYEKHTEINGRVNHIEGQIGAVK